MTELIAELEPRFLLERESYKEGVSRWTDTKRHRRVVIKFGQNDVVKNEVEVYERLTEDGPIIPLIHGRCFHTGPKHDPNYSYIVMEEFAQDLHEFTETHGPLSLILACGVARTILGVWSKAHSKGIVHRDIKRDNVVCSGLELEKLAAIDWNLTVDVSEGSDLATSRGKQGVLDARKLFPSRFPDPRPGSEFRLPTNPRSSPSVVGGRLIGRASKIS